MRQPALAGVAAYELCPRHAPLAETAPSAERWAALVRGLDHEGLAPMAAAAADAGALVLTDGQRAELDALVLAERSRRQRALACLGEAAELVGAEGIDMRVLQGAATAALDYPGTELRSFRNVHLLVSPVQLDEAARILLAHGFVPDGRGRRRVSRRQRGVTLIGPNGVRTGLHRTLVAGPFGATVEPSQMFAHAQVFDDWGRPLVALGTDARFVAACLRSRLDPSPPRLLALRDVAQLALRPDLDPRRVARLAMTWRVEAVVADAVRRAWSRFGIPDLVPLSTWAAGYRPDRRARWRLAGAPSDAWVACR